MNKTKIILMIIIQCCFLVASCKKPPKEQPQSINMQRIFPTNLEVVWNAPFHSDSTSDFFLELLFVDRYVVLANIFEGYGDKPRGIGVYNKQTGKRHTAWQNDPGGIFSTSEFEYILDCKIAGKNKDIILIYNTRYLLGYNLHTGQRMWKLELPDKISGVDIYGNSDFSVAIDHAFITYGPGGLSNTWKRLAIVDVYSGVKRDLVELYAEDNYEFRIHPPTAHVNTEGDTLLFFTTGAWNFAEVRGRDYTYCFNMTKNQMVWTNKHVGGTRTIVIENDKLIVGSIHCLNMHTGEVIWQREGLNAGGLDLPLLYHEEKIYIRHQTGAIHPLWCIDAQSGQLIWENNTLNPAPVYIGTMDIYNDRLYFSAWIVDACYLVCVDIHNGNLLWLDAGPHGYIGFGVHIDKKTGYLYCNTGWSLMCVDLNKTPNGNKDK
jgi:outer membrane protein assembly factor BamB